ncbi:hypothetical protein LJR234_004380 [Mesorhizobium amorphae]|uniref:hypothetical protein n=1 Tax=Mesorhizobium amorphae TaxID=71433 RepID=UPI003ECE653F
MGLLKQAFDDGKDQTPLRYLRSAIAVAFRNRVAAAELIWRPLLLLNFLSQDNDGPMSMVVVK